MTIRVAFAIAAILIGAASAATAGLPQVIKERVFACPKGADTRLITNLYETDPARAGQLAKERKCDILFPGEPVSMTEVDTNTLTACVVPFGATRCVWIPSRKTRSPD